MSVQFILAPLFVQVLLVLCLQLWMFKLRRQALVNREVHPRDIALGEQKWPERATQVANCFRNQFETPVLFYVVTILALITRQADLLFVLLSWVYVVLRYVHAFIHTTTNRVPRRGLVYLASSLVLFGMWLELALRLFLP
jgi:hypothetical protein